ncbi:sulfurtransferase [Methylomicrobium agile]|uniref:sulfurtransferase n=1 Tax=Methylomicrobium agile TaxID=39774 RepID=UPI0004DFA052|nr:sulfurtransferase [Methylomicrobium agile]
MSYSTLISADALKAQIDRPDWVVVDCRFSLADTGLGAKNYRHGHLPNARYAHLDKDLSSAITSRTGRHPLPDFRALAQKLGHWGIDNRSQVVVYDDAGGAFAGRLWWLLRYLGHDKVAVLDGGIKLWQKRGYLITTALPAVKPTIFRPYLQDAFWLTAGQVQNKLAARSICLIDARTPERYRGEAEPIDPVAGHVKGALNRPFQANLAASGEFLPTNQLQRQFQALIGGRPPEQVVHMCGSGVTACHNLLAMEHAGLKGSKLYAGSWSEWIRNKNRPVATGK